MIRYTSLVSTQGNELHELSQFRFDRDSESGGLRTVRGRRSVADAARRGSGSAASRPIDITTTRAFDKAAVERGGKIFMPNAPPVTAITPAAATGKTVPT